MLKPFRIEQYFAKYEFSVKHQFSCSDCESLGLSELLSKADYETKGLWNDLKLSYTETRGHPLLRKEIESLYKTVKDHEIVCLVPEEGIFLSMHALLSEKDHGIALAPAYQSLFEVAESIGCEVTPWKLERKGNRFCLNFELLEKSVKPNTRFLVVNFPHNPTGFLPTIQEWNLILDFAKKYNLYLFSDEMYRGLEFKPEDRLGSAADFYDKAVSLSGFSKTYSLPGLRLGWITSKDQSFIEKLLCIKDYTTICNNAPSEILGIIALRNRKDIIQTNLEIIQANQALLIKLAQNHPDIIDYVPAIAGSVSFPRFKNKADKDVDVICGQMIKEKNLMVLPGSIFDYPEGYFRAGIGRKTFPKALKVMEEFLIENRFV